jgi:hypothetical protein
LIPVADPERKSIEGDTKITVVESVNERIYGAVRPTKPKQKLLQKRVLPNAVF